MRSVRRNSNSSVLLTFSTCVITCLCVRLWERKKHFFEHKEEVVISWVLHYFNPTALKTPRNYYYTLGKKKCFFCDCISLFILNTAQRHEHLPLSFARLKWAFIYRPLLAYKRPMFVLFECRTEVHNGSFASHAEVFSGDCYSHLVWRWYGWLEWISSTNQKSHHEIWHGRS